MDIFIKICGITNAEDAEAVTGLGADALGFIFWKPSGRYVDPRAVGSWDIGPRVKKVGVFVDAEPDEVARAVEESGIDIVQLHGDENPERYRALNVGIWKAVHLSKNLERDWSGVDADAFVLDSYTVDAPGGTGKTVDWERAAEFRGATAIPTVLAGGLGPENIATAIMTVRPWGVDVSTGVETDKRNKDLKKVEEFIALCRRI